jgi:hypothetical protein
MMPLALSLPMKRSILFIPLFLILIVAGYAQDKKVAVVTFYVVKQIDLNGVGSAAQVAMVNQLADDPKFDMAPLLKNFHDRFFENSKSFPFEFVPENEVVNNDAYKNFYPEGASVNEIIKGSANLAANGYKIVLPLKTHENEINLLKIFGQCDGVMKVYLSFDLESRGFGRMALVKINAHANIELFNKKGDKVFTIKKIAMSEKSGAQIAGIPFFTPGKILPLCESSVDQLILALDKDLPKMVSKAGRKL